MKAFESISRISPWNALEQCGIESLYVSLVRRVYERQKGVSLDTQRE